MVSELKRRDPTKRPNKSNRGADEIVGMWEPLTDPRDLAFIKKKEAEYREQMSLLLEQVGMPIGTVILHSSVERATNLHRVHLHPAGQEAQGESNNL